MTDKFKSHNLQVFLESGRKRKRETVNPPTQLLPFTPPQNTHNRRKMKIIYQVEFQHKVKSCIEDRLDFKTFKISILSIQKKEFIPGLLF